MSDIFIAYARKDRVVAEELTTEFNRLGFSVFYDINIAPGDVWRDTITSALEKAAVVVVLWSESSIQSEWVRAEADMALRDNKLLPILISSVEIPLGFSHIQTLDLSHVEGHVSSDKRLFEQLVSAVSGFTREERVTGYRASHPDTPGDRVIVEEGRTYKSLSDASKTQLFLAHASADKPKLMPVIKVLIDQGFRVWIDKPQEVGLDRAYESRIARDRILFGNDWKESIRLAVKKADAVLAFWSKDAVNGRREQFHYEVYLGMMQKKLNQCRIDTVEIDRIGMPYTFDHIADLSDVAVSEYHPELDYLMQDVCRKNRSWWKLWRV
ncbi:MAG: toll/interleukin-1 receptor domain-containing protein [Candidatus Thiodiazotropha sp. DIVDIV]